MHHLANKEYDEELRSQVPLDKKLKAIHDFELVHPDPKPPSFKKVTELDKEEAKRKYEYLENEKRLKEKYANYDPTDKLHDYFNKSLEENKGLITEKREREEIDK